MDYVRPFHLRGYAFQLRLNSIGSVGLVLQSKRGTDFSIGQAYSWTQSQLLGFDTAAVLEKANELADKEDLRAKWLGEGLTTQARMKQVFSDLELPE